MVGAQPAKTFDEIDLRNGRGKTETRRVLEGARFQIVVEGAVGRDVRESRKDGLGNARPRLAGAAPLQSQKVRPSEKHPLTLPLINPLPALEPRSSPFQSRVSGLGLCWTCMVDLEPRCLSSHASSQ